MSSPFVPIKTASLYWRGNLPFSSKYDDIYFSAGDGIKHSKHVFIDGNDLTQRWSSLPKDEASRFNIAETGFGTGLNFLLSWHLWEQYSPPLAQLHFISCEKNPLTRNDLIRCMDLWPELKPYAKQLIEHYPLLTPGYHHLSFLNGRVHLTLMLGDAFECFEQLLLCGESQLESTLRSTWIDAWYLDGFSPKKNPDIWSADLINVIAMLSRPGTTLATYTAAAPIKLALKNVGFRLEKKKGFGPKRHMTCAYFNNTPSFRLKTRHTPWHTNTPNTPKENSAIIVGAGLAGCLTAHSLAKKGWTVTLIDELNGVGKGGSANRQAVLFPKLSAYKSPLTQFMLSAFLYATRYYKVMLSQHELGELKGSLLLAYNDKEKKAQHSLGQWLQHYPELGRLVDINTASDLSGCSMNKSGLFIPLSGWIDSPALCKVLIDTQGITLISNETVNSIEYHTPHWTVNGLKASVLVLANGPKVNLFKETQHLPIKTIRGQMTMIETSSSSEKLIIPLSAEGHVLPQINGTHGVGATYELGELSPDAQIYNDELNVSKLKHIASDIVWSNTVREHWAGVRAATSDYLPLVGPIANADDFLKRFSGLESNSKRWIAKPGSYHQGLYVCAGFGSRGLTTIPLCAEWLASLINNEMSCLPRNLIQAIAPARFLRKNITRGLS